MTRAANRSLTIPPDHLEDSEMTAFETSRAWRPAGRLGSLSLAALVSATACMGGSSGTTSAPTPAQAGTIRAVDVHEPGAPNPRASAPVLVTG